MKVAIDVRDDVYNKIREGGFWLESGLQLSDAYDAIKYGTPIPKEHGRLLILSEDAIKREQMPLSSSCQKWISEVGLSNATVATIESDTAESEDKGMNSYQMPKDYLRNKLDYSRLQGKWLIVKDKKYGDNVKCPFCGKELAGTDLNFCCKCGAKLIGSEKMNGGA